MPVITWFELIPVNEIVGVEDILSEKVAVIVTTSEFMTILSESVSVKITVGEMTSLELNLPTKIPLPKVEATTLWLAALVPVISKSLTLTSVIPLFDWFQLGLASVKFIVFQTPKSVPRITSSESKGLGCIAKTGISGRLPSLTDQEDPLSLLK